MFDNLRLQLFVFLFFYFLQSECFLIVIISSPFDLNGPLKMYSRHQMSSKITFSKLYLQIQEHLQRSSYLNYYLCKRL